MINVGIVVDWMGSGDFTAEEEIDEIMKRLGSWLKGASLKLAAHSYSVHQSTKEHIDLLVLDYGGVLPGADDMVNSQMREAKEWAENHPSGLLFLYTDYTRQLYEAEIGSELDEINNVVFRHQEDSIFEGLVGRMRRWFGLPEEPNSEAHDHLIAPGRPNGDTGTVQAE
jgi:hypothetical protein